MIDIHNDIEDLVVQRDNVHRMLEEKQRRIRELQEHVNGLNQDLDLLQQLISRKKRQTIRVSIERVRR